MVSQVLMLIWVVFMSIFESSSTCSARENPPRRSSSGNRNRLGCKVHSLRFAMNLAARLRAYAVANEIFHQSKSLGALGASGS